MLEADKALSNKDQPAFQKQAEFAVGQPIEPRIVIHCFANSASLPSLCLIWSSSPLFANAWNSDWKEEEETDNIRFNFFNGLKVGYFAHCDVETVKRTN